MLHQLYTRPFASVVEAINTKQHASLPHLVVGLDQSARAILIAAAYDQNPRPLLVVEPTQGEMMALYEDLVQLLPDQEIHLFTPEESLALEYVFSSQDTRSQRLDALMALSQGENSIVITTLAGVRSRLTPLDKWQQQQLHLEIGQDYSLTQLEQQFVQLGYRREPMVTVPGEFSVRGGIVDYYPLTATDPIRLDFFDTELDSIRTFDVQDQTSLSNLDEARITPATDVLFSVAEQQSIVETLERRFRSALAKVEDDDLARTMSEGMQEEIAKLKSGEPLTYPSAYLSLWDEEETSLLDYLSSDGDLFICEWGKQQQIQQQLIEEDQFWIEQETAKGLLLPQLEIKHEGTQLLRDYSQEKVYLSAVQQGMVGFRFADIHTFQYRSMNQFFNQLPLIKTEMDHWLQQETVIQVVVNSDQAANKTERLFLEHDIQPVVIQGSETPQPEQVNIIVGQLMNGFELPSDHWVVLTEKELFDKLRQRHIAPRHDLSNAERIKDYQELEVGDYVVHVNHGIGKYTGIETMKLKDVNRDLLAVEFEGGSRILIPIDQIHLLQKYVSAEGTTPKLTKLGSSTWQKTRHRVAKQVEDIADELIELYAEREQERGYAFSPDTPEQQEFENEFPYVETPDQLRSAKEIKDNMEQVQPMDRLLVGDVGYGKTEVAMRAIFKAVMEGKQVAFLVPTTILAQQHYNTLMERFAQWPFEIAMLSRFVTAKQQKEVIEGLKIGAISIVVGTHRLLSKDIQFQDLGLLIVDEEQRFGVKHKERLKQLKSQVDVLTLTATPIPRTLHMSMVGVRDLSVIETPPVNRFPVQTYVMERNEAVVKSAIEREMARGGQAFYLYNRVATIYQRASEIMALVPEARVAVAHGQMTERELEEVLLDFVQGEYDVLVTTTIIETGVDIPNANTLFIENADHMGLSTLYQIRGRVGRSHRIAYAYLMYEPMKQLNEVSQKRLDAIREFTELGSGFKIAMRDLSIRGAGNLLGAEQSGFINSVGFDLYAQLLQEAIERKQGKETDTQLSDKELEWTVHFDAYIPADYIADERQKIAIYKAVQRIKTEEGYRDLQDQLIDRYGEFPDPMANLLDVGLIRAYGLKSGIEKIMQTGGQLKLTFSPRASEQLQGPILLELLAKTKVKTQVKQLKDHLEVTLDIRRLAVDEWLNELIVLTRALADYFQSTADDSSTKQTTKE